MAQSSPQESDVAATAEAGGGRRGLSEAEAAARLKAEGPNELPSDGGRSPFRIALEVLREPMLALLIGGGVVYLLLGDTAEAILLMCFASLSIVITVVQETRTERVLEALRDLASPRALVIRGGVPRRIPGREVVRGDLVSLLEGDRVPADALLLECSELSTDESLLTGESVPVRKRVAGPEEETAGMRPGGDGLPVVYSGSLIVHGTGLGEVTATGPRSEMGKIGQTLQKLTPEPPRLRAQITRLVGLFGLAAGLVTLIVVLLYGLLRGGWLDAVLAGIALGMSMLPEEFPLVLTVFMAMGAWRISRARVLTRRAAAIETLGSATVLCTDKTGTLTQNRMTVAELRLADGSSFVPEGAAVPEGFHDLVEAAALAAARDEFDPMEAAFRALTDLPGVDGAARVRNGSGVHLRAYGIRPELLAATQVWRAADGLVAAAKGAPEAIAAACGMSAAERDGIEAEARKMAAEGLRVLGVARARPEDGALPDSQHGFAFEFLGLAGLADPLREGVPDAVAECAAAGIRVVMITGDYPETARAIAESAGISTELVLTGADVDACDLTGLCDRVIEASVFARIMPEQKLRIVEALKQSGEVVAMTGDGVNDAPALKSAHIGIAMGGRGTDVAREAASIVLLDDDFASIVKAIRLGRRIYDNLVKALGFIFAVHVPIAGLALLPLLFGFPILLAPVHIAFMEMIIDPVCSLVFEAEAEEDNVMRRPPREPAAPLVSGHLAGWSLLQGAIAFAVVAGVFVIALDRGMAVDEVRALAFFSLVVAIVALIFANRSFGPSPLTAVLRPNGLLGAALAVVAMLLGLVMAWPFARDLFAFGPLHLNDLAVVAGVWAVVLLAVEGLKLVAAALRRADGAANDAEAW